MKPIDEDSELYLVGFRIEPDIFDPQMFTIYVNDDRPILFEGQPILFPRAELAPNALKKSDCGASSFGVAPTELYCVYDIASAIYTLNEKDEDESNEVLNLINLVLDFANCGKERMPATYRADLSLLADHLTFNYRFTEFLQQHELDRQRVIDALYWAIGMVIYTSKIIVR